MTVVDQPDSQAPTDCLNVAYRRRCPMTAEDEVGHRFHAALDSIVDGDAPPMAEVWSHDSGVSTMHPLAGREHGAVRPRRGMRSLFAGMCAVMAPIGGFWRADGRADTAVCF